MKKLKTRQLGPWCSFCPPKTTKATWRTSGVALNRYCCETHKAQLTNWEVARQDDGRMSEGDYESWGRQ